VTKTSATVIIIRPENDTVLRHQAHVSTRIIKIKPTRQQILSGRVDGSIHPCSQINSTVAVDILTITDKASRKRRISEFTGSVIIITGTIEVRATTLGKVIHRLVATIPGIFTTVRARSGWGNCATVAVVNIETCISRARDGKTEFSYTAISIYLECTVSTQNFEVEPYIRYINIANLLRFCKVSLSLGWAASLLACGPKMRRRASAYAASRSSNVLIGRAGPLRSWLQALQ
jgi:hypothetical protein